MTTAPLSPQLENDFSLSQSSESPAYFAIVNPASQSGKTRKNWPHIHRYLESRLGPVQYALTEGPRHATQLTREALQSGVRQLLVVGGDGTLNEVVNGWFENDQPLQPEAVLSLLMQGTGGDFRKSLGLQNTLESYVQAMLGAPVQNLDVARVRLTGNQGEPVVSYFANIASFGLGGEVVNLLAHSEFLKGLGGTPGFLLATLQTLAQYQPMRVKLSLDQGPAEELLVYHVAAANGRYQGGGMFIAPCAELNDGQLDVIVLADVSKLTATLTFPQVYLGQHLSSPHVRYLRARQLKAEPVDHRPVWIELDGELPGRLPAEIEILPQCLKLKAPTGPAARPLPVQ